MIVLGITTIACAVTLYFVGLYMAHAMKHSGEKLYITHGSPSFIIAGPSEYKFIFNVILSRKAQDIHNTDALILVKAYRALLLLLIILMMALMVLFTNQS